MENRDIGLVMSTKFTYKRGCLATQSLITSEIKHLVHEACESLLLGVLRKQTIIEQPRNLDESATKIIKNNNLGLFVQVL